MIEAILEPENLAAAWQRVKANQGAPGIDGMTVAAHRNRGHRVEDVIGELSRYVRGWLNYYKLSAT